MMLLDAPSFIFGLHVDIKEQNYGFIGQFLLVCMHACVNAKRVS